MFAVNLYCMISKKKVVLYLIQVMLWGMGSPPPLHVSSAFSNPTCQWSVEEEMVASGGSDMNTLVSMNVHRNVALFSIFTQ